MSHKPQTLKLTFKPTLDRSDPTLQDMVEAMQRHEVDVVCPKKNRVITIQPNRSAVSAEKKRPPD